MEDSANNAKVSDSAYSNSCSNSQSRRSHSSKSTHSGSHSSGSSGYGGKPSISGSRNALGQAPEKRSKEKDLKKKSTLEPVAVEPLVEAEARPQETEVKVDDTPNETKEIDVVQSPGTALTQAAESQVENMDIVTSGCSYGKEEEPPVPSTTLVMNAQLIQCSTAKPNFTACSDGFSCVISMHDGVVMYTTSTITNSLGFPKDMWIGRPFIDFVHPKDCNTFASQIMCGVAVPKNVRTQPVHKTVLTMCCRIRTYRGLTTGFATKNRVVTFLPCILNLSFKDIPHEDGKTVYLVIQAMPLYTAYKVPNEAISKPTPFITRHVANGKFEYIDPESVPYLGYLPQDLLEKDAIQLYHPDDLNYLLQIYEKIMRATKTGRSRTYRMLAQNGDYVKLETEFSCFVNPWSKKLEFICGKHYIVEGPSNPDVFKIADKEKSPRISENMKIRVQSLREGIVKIMSEMASKTTEVAKQQTSKRCMELAASMESLVEQQPKQMDELKLEIQEPDHSYFERDSVMLGGISPHHENDSKSSTETPLSYNQLNYNETLQRYFDSYQPCTYDEYRTVNGDNILGDQIMSLQGPSQLGGSVTLMPAAHHDCHLQRLSEPLLFKHNSDMEKELVKKHRETRSYTKMGREKTIKENRQKKKDHLARCNAPYQPTSAEAAFSIDEQAPGLKRPLRPVEVDTTSHKHHCSWSHSDRHRMANNVASAPPKPAYADNRPPGNQWAGPTTSGGTHYHACDKTQQKAMINPVAAVQGVFPMYYVPNTPTTAAAMGANPQTSQIQYAQVPYVMYPPSALFGRPLMYSPIGLQAVQGTVGPPVNNMHCHYEQKPLGLASSNYQEACIPSLALELGKSATSQREKKPFHSQGTSSSRAIRGSEITSIRSSTLTSSRLSFEQILSRNSDSMRITPESLQDFRDNSSYMLSCDKTSGNDSSDGNYKMPRVRNASRSKGKSNEGTADKTDGESSYSSFSSSFFITEPGSTEESDNKNNKNICLSESHQQVPTRDGDFFNYRDKKVAKRKGPPWMEKVTVTSELIYKYQMTSRTKDEILEADKQRMNNLEQPYLVNEQLSQLYLDLQLEGAPSRLTLEEGITSSGSSGEETIAKLLTPKRAVVKTTRRKREYSRLVMIYEEDAPIPPPITESGTGLLAPSPMEQIDNPEPTTSKANT